MKYVKLLQAENDKEIKIKNLLEGLKEKATRQWRDEDLFVEDINYAAEEYNLNFDDITLEDVKKALSKYHIGEYKQLKDYPYDIQKMIIKEYKEITENMKPFKNEYFIVWS